MAQRKDWRHAHQLTRAPWYPDRQHGRGVRGTSRALRPSKPTSRSGLGYPPRLPPASRTPVSERPRPLVPGPALRAAGLVALVALAYAPALDGGFVWDDVAIVREPVLHAWSGLVDIWLSPRRLEREGHYWPVVYTTFWLEHKLWGLDPVGYRAVNVALHAVNTVLAWRLLARLSVPGAWLGAALFAVHPVHAQSVAWIIERKDLLSALFWLLAAFAWLRFERSPRPARHLLVLALYVAALLSKSVAVTFPAALALCAWWRRGTLTRRDGLRLAPLFAAGLLVTLGDLLYYRSVESVSFAYSFPERVVNAGHALWHYLATLLVPFDLLIVYPFPSASAADPAAWLPALGVLVLALALWAGRSHLGRGPFAALAFFVLTLSPMLGFVDFGYMRFSLVADRFQYLASLGPLALAGSILARWVATPPPALGRAVAIAAPVALAGLLGALAVAAGTHARLHGDPVAAFEQAAAHNPGNAELAFNFARALHDDGALERSAGVAVRAAALHPGNPGFPHQAGESLRKLGRDAEAVAHYREALGRDPRHARAHAGLGLALLALDRPGDALAPLERAAALSPSLAGSLHPWIGRAYVGLGRLCEAADAYRHAIAAAPARASLHANLGAILSALGAIDAAVASYEQALILDPSLDAARRGRAAALVAPARSADRCAGA